MPDTERRRRVLRIGCGLWAAFLGFLPTPIHGRPKDLCPIIPKPKVYKELGAVWTLASGERCAIVIGATASPQERYAAGRLQRLIERRFARRLSIVTEEQAGGVGQWLLLGRRRTNAALDALCKSQAIQLDAQHPGHDGFVIEMIKAGGREVILLGGSNDRGAIYAADTFFDLLQQQKGRVVFPAVSVRDRPSIPWRGAATQKTRQLLRSDELDMLIRFRINWIDLRNVMPLGHPGAKRFNFGMGMRPGQPIDKALVRTLVAEAHRRGMFVYATVACAADRRSDRDDTADVLRTFEELIRLGADGLWLSFDDHGWAKGTERKIRRKRLST